MLAVVVGVARILPKTPGRMSGLCARAARDRPGFEKFDGCTENNSFSFSSRRAHNSPMSND
jgi:hypothetical protein